MWKYQQFAANLYEDRSRIILIINASHIEIIEQGSDVIPGCHWTGLVGLLGRVEPAVVGEDKSLL